MQLSITPSTLFTIITFVVSLASDMAAQMKVQGTVTSLNEPNGFGMIGIVIQNNEAKGYLARLSDVKTEGFGRVSVGQLVEFTTATGDNGEPVALDVTVIGGAVAPDTADHSKAPDEEKASK